MRGAAVVERDDFAKVHKIFGVEAKFRGIDAGDTYALESWVPFAGGPALHRVLVRHSYAEPTKLWSIAFDEAGRERPVISLQRSRACHTCPLIIERFAVELAEPELRAAAGRGLRLKLYARHGDNQVIEITPAQIAAQLAALDVIAR